MIQSNLGLFFYFQGNLYKKVTICKHLLFKHHNALEGCLSSYFSKG